MDATVAVAAITAGAGLFGSGITLLGTHLNGRRSDHQAAQRARDDYLRRRHDRFDQTLAELAQTTTSWARNQGITLRNLQRGVADSDPELFWPEAPEGDDTPDEQ